jgi:hypothetical protein
MPKTKTFDDLVAEQKQILLARAEARKQIREDREKAEQDRIAAQEAAAEKENQRQAAVIAKYGVVHAAAYEMIPTPEPEQIQDPAYQAKLAARRRGKSMRDDFIGVHGQDEVEFERSEDALWEKAKAMHKAGVLPVQIQIELGLEREEVEQLCEVLA